MGRRTKFRIDGCNIMLDGAKWYENEDVIDMERISPYSVFHNHSPGSCEMSFTWDDDLAYNRYPRINLVRFINQQEKDMAWERAKELRAASDLKLMERDMVRVEIIHVGSNDWNGTEWVGKIHATNLRQPNFLLDVSNHILSYGILETRERIRNPRMVRLVAELLGPDKCINLPPDGLDHNFCKDFTCSPDSDK